MTKATPTVKTYLGWVNTTFPNFLIIFSKILLRLIAIELLSHFFKLITAGSHETHIEFFYQLELHLFYNILTHGQHLHQ